MERAVARFCFLRRSAYKPLKKHKKKLGAKNPKSRVKINLIPAREEIVSLVSEFAETLCVSEGMELVYVEYQRERGGRILRLYIDRPGGVRLDDCVNISRQVGDFLDVALESNLSYNLEVTSPGPNRPLGKKLDFERFNGKIATIKTHQPVDGQKKFIGVLSGTSGNIVKLLIDDKTVAIPFQEIARAWLVNYNGE